MAQTRYYDPTWMGQWRADTKSYVGGGSPIRVGGSQGYNSYIGFPSQVRSDINSSSIPVKLEISIHVTNAAEFDVGAHKRTSNPGGGGLPFYEYIGLHPYLSTGRKKIDLTSAFVNRYTNQGFEGIVLYGGSNFGQAYGLTGNSYRAQIQLTGQWNSPPTKPTVTYPNGGETITGKVTLKAKPATDPDEPQSQLRYQWAIWDGDWNYLPLSNPGVTNIDVDFSKYRETSKAKVGVRAFDSSEGYSKGNYGPYDYSDGVFTIRHNLPPTSPTGLTPSGGETLDRTQVIALRWKHNDTGNQSRYKVRWRRRGTSTWTEITKDSVNQYHYMNPGSLPNGMIEWQVMTFDQYQLASPWSNTSIFNASDPTDEPSIITPDSNGIVTVTNPVLEWSSIDQVEYEYQLLNGDNVLYEVSKIGENKAETLDYELENDADYTIRLRIKASSGLWSDWSEVSFRTSFTTPLSPIMDIVSNNEEGSISLVIDNPYPNQGEPPVAYNSVYRRESGAADWIQIEKIVSPGATFTDYTPGSDTEYEYKVVGHGTNGTTTETAPSVGSIVIDDVLLMVVSNPEMVVRLRYNPSRNFDYNFEMSETPFQGRQFPMAEFGPSLSIGMDFSFVIRDRETLNQLLEVVRSKETLLYRDNRGRREFIATPSLSVKDARSNNYEVSFSPTRVYYKENQS